MDRQSGLTGVGIAENGLPTPAPRYGVLNAISTTPRSLPQSKSPQSKAGLAYEGAVARGLLRGDFTDFLCNSNETPLLRFCNSTNNPNNLLIFKLIKNPWFSYTLSIPAKTSPANQNQIPANQIPAKTKPKLCSPDILLFCKLNPPANFNPANLNNFDFIILIEVKLTWTQIAWEKLNNLYLPIILQIYNLPTFPLVICKNLTLNSPQSKSKLGEALNLKFPLLHYLGSGPLF